MYQKTLILIKPDGLQRRLAGRILQRFEDAGLKLHAIKLVQPTPEMTKVHYQEHVEKPFYPSLEQYLCAGPVVALVLGGMQAIPTVRKMVGATNPPEAAPGTIRGDLAHQVLVKGAGGQERPLHNLIHASAEPDEAEHEIAVWFQPGEVLDYPMLDDYLHGF